MSLEIHQEECRNEFSWRFTRKNVETINELNDVSLRFSRKNVETINELNDVLGDLPGIM